MKKGLASRSRENAAAGKKGVFFGGRREGRTKKRDGVEDSLEVQVNLSINLICSNGSNAAFNLKIPQRGRQAKGYFVVFVVFVNSSWRNARTGDWL